MKKLLATALALLMCALPVLALGDITKDETVYALLGADGAVQQVLVVSHIDTPEDGEYVDYGTYENVAAMVTEDTPNVEGDAITWSLPANAEGFFAVGQLEDAALPFLVEISATLDGEATTPEALAGQSGHVEMTLSVKANPAAEEAFRTRYMAQVQVPLSLSSASAIDAPGATAALVGQVNTLTYTVLPGQDATFTLSFDATDFSMDSVTIACATMDIEGMLGLDITDLTGQTAELSDGAKTLADGGAQLADGLDTLAGGVGSLAEAAAALPDGATQLADGLTALSAAVGQLPAQVQQLNDASTQLSSGVASYVQGTGTALAAVPQLSDGLATLAASGEPLAQGVAALQTSLAAFLSMLPEAQATALEAQLTALVEGVTQYTQGVTAISGQTAQLAGSIAPLTQGSAALTEGLSQQGAGIAQLTEGLTALATQTQALPTGAQALADGTQQVADALGTLNESVASLPEQARQLADGQATLADGVAQAIEALDDMPLAAGDDPLPSFASPAHTARSVQFVYRTEAIAPQADDALPVQAEEAQGFWARLTALFK